MRRFTFGRLMAVIAVIAIVLGGYIQVAYMRPSFRETDGPPTCQTHLRNVVLGVLQYANSEGAFPTATWSNESLSPEKRLSWHAATLPYNDMQDLWAQLDKTQPWDGNANQRIASTHIRIYKCTDVPGVPVGQPEPTQYIGIAGLGTDAPFMPEGHPRAGVFGYDRRTTLADIKDGASSTMIVAESARVGGSWLEGGPATVRGLDTADLPYIGPGRQFGSVHRFGTNVAFADGSVRFVRDTINPRILEAFSTIAGGETVPANLFDD